MSRIIYYYQTFIGLKLDNDTPITHIHLSAIHFGKNPDGSPYIHLNNYPPNNKVFDSVWKDIKKAKELGIKIVLMVGGAGSAYNVLFSDFETYYPLLVKTIKEHPEIDGIDLDVEEYVSLDNIKMLINKIDEDFGKDFIISMAPIQSSLQQNQPGMGGFIYKDLYQSKEGQRINYFNGQFYSDYSVNSYKQVINNGYPADKVVMGMISSQDLGNAVDVVSELSKEYSDFGGVFDWEYFDAPPSPHKNPSMWSYEMKKAMEHKAINENNILDEMNYCRIS